MVPHPNTSWFWYTVSALTPPVGGGIDAVDEPTTHTQLLVDPIVQYAKPNAMPEFANGEPCLLYTSDAADD